MGSTTPAVARMPLIPYLCAMADVHDIDDFQYLRDKRSPVPKSDTVSRVMSANKAKDTKPEKALREALRISGLIGYRLHYEKMPGRPDICFVSKKIAIFVNGCFWHRCPHCNYPYPKNNQVFWKDKFDKNIARDQKKIDQLHALGWRTFVVWECEIKKDVATLVRSIQNADTMPI
jgi:DNA mismatch endonuclease (patch repair protein)